MNIYSFAISFDDNIIICLLSKILWKSLNINNTIYLKKPKKVYKVI